MARAASREANDGRRRRAPSASALLALASGDRADRRDDRLVEPEPGEGARTRLLGEQQRGPAHRVADAEELAGGHVEVVDHRQQVVAHRRPRQRGAGRHHRGAVGSEVDRPALEPVAEGGRHRLPHGTVEAGGMAEEGGAALAAVLVHGQRDTVGGGHRAHRCILVGRRRARRIASGRCPTQPSTRSTRATRADEAEVRLANRRFYDAFEARDLDAMSDVWEHDDRVSCTHPGWRTLHGWGAVSGSWFALFGGPQPLQFILTDEQVAVEGDAAWVTVDENLISADGSGTVAAVNVFVRSDGRWRLVAHHGSAVAPQG